MYKEASSDSQEIVSKHTTNLHDIQTDISLIRKLVQLNFLFAWKNKYCNDNNLTSRFFTRNIIIPRLCATSLVCSY